MDSGRPSLLLLLLPIPHDLRISQRFRAPIHLGLGLSNLNRDLLPHRIFRPRGSCRGRLDHILRRRRCRRRCRTGCVGNLSDGGTCVFPLLGRSVVRRRRLGYPGMRPERECGLAAGMARRRPASSRWRHYCTWGRDILP